MSRTPHPSRYAIHLLPLEKAYCNRTLFVTIISVFVQQSVRFDDIYIRKAWFKTSLLQWENNVREANLASCLRQRWWRRSRRMRCHKHTDKSKFELSDIFSFAFFLPTFSFAKEKVGRVPDKSQFESLCLHMSIKMELSTMTIYCIFALYFRLLSNNTKL